MHTCENLFSPVQIFPEYGYNFGNARDQQAIEAVRVEETEEVYQDEQQLQEFEVAEEGQVSETDLANPDLQQGKPRFI